MPAAPRSVAWLLIVASAGAVLLTGIATTVGIAARVGTPMESVDSSFWTGLGVAAVLTLASLSIRALRWVYLLRRSEIRIPIRDAYIGYLAGFSLLLAPLLLGEILVRAYVHRARCRVAPAKTAQVNVWERLCDVLALGLIASTASLGAAFGSVVILVAAVLFSRTRTWAVATLASFAAWMLPVLGFWWVANAAAALSFADAQRQFAWSSLVGGFSLAPGGVLVTGYELIRQLEGSGLRSADAVSVVFAVRLATVGVSTALGMVMLGAHFASRRGGSHFDEIAEAYDAQIPADRRDALLTRKTALMRSVLERHGGGGRGLDVGCGQGWYVARMRSLGFDVEGIDASPGQLAIAAGQVGSPALIRIGSVLDIPAADGSYDFAYIINVLHHLSSIEEQRKAFAEMTRVLRPGGLLFVHEINTRNPLFRFYMGYVFPTLNCIDEGVERWLLPHRLARYTDLPMREAHYFTFLPEFLPQLIVTLLGPLERWLERSRLAPFSAHYMAVLQKPA